jgi:hypothetical protein
VSRETRTTTPSKPTPPKPAAPARATNRGRPGEAGAGTDVVDRDPTCWAIGLTDVETNRLYLWHYPKRGVVSRSPKALAPGDHVVVRWSGDADLSVLIPWRKVPKVALVVLLPHDVRVAVVDRVAKHLLAAGWNANACQCRPIASTLVGDVPGLDWCSWNGELTDNLAAEHFQPTIGRNWILDAGWTLAPPTKPAAIGGRLLFDRDLPICGRRQTSYSYAHLDRAETALLPWEPPVGIQSYDPIRPCDRLVGISFDTALEILAPYKPLPQLTATAIGPATEAKALVERLRRRGWNAVAYDLTWRSLGMPTTDHCTVVTVSDRADPPVADPQLPVVPAEVLLRRAGGPELPTGTDLGAFNQRSNLFFLGDHEVSRTQAAVVCGNYGPTGGPATMLVRSPVLMAALSDDATAIAAIADALVGRTPLVYPDGHAEDARVPAPAWAKAKAAAAVRDLLSAVNTRVAAGVPKVPGVVPRKVKAALAGEGLHHVADLQLLLAAYGLSLLVGEADIPSCAATDLAAAIQRLLRIRYRWHGDQSHRAAAARSGVRPSVLGDWMTKSVPVLAGRLGVIAAICHAAGIPLVIRTMEPRVSRRTVTEIVGDQADDEPPQVGEQAVRDTDGEVTRLAEKILTTAKAQHSIRQIKERAAIGGKTMDTLLNGSGLRNWRSIAAILDAVGLRLVVGSGAPPRSPRDLAAAIQHALKKEMPSARAIRNKLNTNGQIVARWSTAKPEALGELLGPLARIAHKYHVGIAVVPAR